jgi:tetratricopeptide (TPR) repeat protein
MPVSRLESPHGSDKILIELTALYRGVRLMATALELYDEADKYKAAGDLQAAADKLQAAIAADPKYALAYSALAVVLQRLGQHAGAIEAAQKVCELEPGDPFSFTALSVTFQRAYAGTGEMQYIRLAEDAMERSRMLQMR